MLIVGQRALDFVLPPHAGGAERFYAVAGGEPVLLVFGAPAALARFGVDDLAAALSRTAARERVTLVLVIGGGLAPELPAGRLERARFVDADGAVFKKYGVDPSADEATVLLLDPNLRLLTTLRGMSSEQAAAEVAWVLDEQLPRLEPIEVVMQAPVLLVPNALDAGLCRELISVFEGAGGLDSGIETSKAGRRRLLLDHVQKQRRDHTVDDPELLRLLTAAVGRRVISEVDKAFAFKATRFEGFKIACYDAEEHGHFRRHRDNLSPATQHRRFALTLNLNEGYEGGHLRFPEYGPHLYRPPTGGAVIFSGSHLHEVLPVTAGKRFVLLSFLFGAADGRG